MGDLDLDAVEARFDQVAGARARSRRSPRGCRRSSIALVLKWLDGSGIWVGAHRMCGGCSSEVWPPWVSCPKILAPWACTPSVILRWCRNDLRVPGIDEAPRHLAGRMDRLALEHDQADTAPCPLLVIGGVGIGRHAVEVAEGGEMRLEHEAVAQFHWADGKRREQEGELVVARRSTVTSIGRHEKMSTCLSHGFAL